MISHYTITFSVFQGSALKNYKMFAFASVEARKNPLREFFAAFCKDCLTERDKNGILNDKGIPLEIEKKPRVLQLSVKKRGGICYVTNQQQNVSGKTCSF